MRASPHPSADAKARAVAWLTAWDSQGAHRSATTGDEAGALWLADEAAGLGVEVATEAFALDRLDPVACYLELDGERISAVPAFAAPATGDDGVIGMLSFSDHDEAILVAKPAPQSVYTGEYERLRRDTAHRALVIVPPLLPTSGDYDAPQLVVAVDGRAGRWPGLLARITTRADRGPASL